MESALIITSTEKSFEAIAELLHAHSKGAASPLRSPEQGLIYETLHVFSGSEGRRVLMERDFDIVFISAPLPDENGEILARQIAASEVSQVILAVKSEIYDAVSSVCEKEGIFTISKPVNRDILRQVLSLAKTMHTRLSFVKSENESLKQKIDYIRIIDRAKSILISSTRMSEHEAHRYIEKRAMDTRSSKREVSEGIIHDYEYGE